MPFPPPQITCHSERQYGLVTRPQLRNAGCTPGQIDGWVARGQLVTPFGRGGAYRLAGAPVPDAQRHLAAVLRAGRGALLDGYAALALHGVEGFDLDCPPQVLIPLDRRVKGVHFRVGHGPISPADSTMVGGISVVTASRALLDVAHRLTVKALRVAVDDARRRGLVRLDRMVERAVALDGHRGAQAFLRVYATRTFDQESEGERVLAPWLATVALVGQWGTWVLPGIKFDAWFPEALLAVEYDGRNHHTLPTDKDHEEARRLKIRAAGIECLVITKAMLEHEAAATMERVRAIYDARVRALQPA